MTTDKQAKNLVDLRFLQQRVAILAAEVTRRGKVIERLLSTLSKREKDIANLKRSSVVK